MPRGKACKKKSALVSMIHDSTTMIKNKHCLYFSIISVKVKISEKPEMVLKDRNRMMNLIMHASPKKKKGAKKEERKFLSSGRKELHAIFHARNKV